MNLLRHWSYSIRQRPSPWQDSPASARQPGPRRSNAEPDFGLRDLYVRATAVVRCVRRVGSAGATGRCWPRVRRPCRRGLTLTLRERLAPQLHYQLGEMFVSDPRFTATYEAIAPGLATWVRAAIEANAQRLAS